MAGTLALAGATASTAQTDTDTDGDGVYSYAEMLAVYPDLTEATFLIIDSDASGTIDADEMASAQDQGLIPTEG
jgi:hypothetical protein